MICEQQQFEEHTELLTAQWTLRQELVAARKQLLEQQEIPSEYSFAGIFELYCNGEVLQPVPFPIPMEVEHLLHISKWGSYFSALLLTWLPTLKWPSLDSLEHSEHTVTWMELLFNFMLAAQIHVPQRWTLPDNTTIYVMLDDEGPWNATQFTLNDAIFSFQGAVRHLEVLLDTALVPKTRGNLVSSIYKLGSSNFKKGFLQRPQMSSQADTMQWVVDYLTQHTVSRKTHFEELPMIPERPAIVRTQIQIPEDNSWKDRQFRYRQWQLSRRKRG